MFLIARCACATCERLICQFSRPTTPTQTWHAFQGFDPDTEARAAVFSACQATATALAAPGSWLQLAIAHAADDQPLGDCARQLCAHEPRITETGITMAPRWQGQGLARKAVHELLALCFG